MGNFNKFTPEQLKQGVPVGAVRHVSPEKVSPTVIEAKQKSRERIDAAKRERLGMSGQMAHIALGAVESSDELDLMAGISFTPDLGESIINAAKKPEASKGEV